ncbi:hypothetical protein [Hymenobacter psychrophilus]|uniref:hypothetical protein n=1 Tax=Hymenobacter psychrophilus TaxID=651662 RepID=UPI0015873E1A|nr:hypothetical protein [Hymenobacter psychrophilus]
MSEEADEDGYVVGYVALAHLITHRDLLREYGAFIMRTGQLRPIGEPAPVLEKDEPGSW